MVVRSAETLVVLDLWASRASQKTRNVPENLPVKVLVCIPMLTLGGDHSPRITTRIDSAWPDARWRKASSALSTA